jgi:polar amino acid transport system permease protein
VVDPETDTETNTKAGPGTGIGTEAASEVDGKVDAEAGSEAEGTALRRRPRRHPWQWAGTVVVLVLAAMLANGLVTNPHLQWGVVGDYLFSGDILRGLARTLELTAGTMIIATLLGTLIAVMRLSGSRLLSSVAGVYIWILRSVPLLVQLLFWYNISALYPHLSIGVPFGPAAFTFNANSVLTPLVAALVALGLETSAFIAEIVRAGLTSVPQGQLDAASALGLRGRSIFRRVVLPQALPVIVPPLGNMLVITIKATSLVSVISLSDLLYSAETIYGRTYQTIPLLLVATIWYIVVTLVLSVGQGGLERALGHGDRSGTGRPRMRRFGRDLWSGLAHFVVPARGEGVPR